MLLDHVVMGLGFFAFWQTYAASLPLLILSKPEVQLRLVNVALRAGWKLGPILMPLVLSLLHATALLYFVLSLSPILLGLSGDAAWTSPFLLAMNAPRIVIIVLLKMVAADMLLGLVPGMNSFTPFNTLVLGGLALVFFVDIGGGTGGPIVSANIHFWPGIWFVLGSLFVSWCVGWLGALLGSSLFLIASREKAIAFGWQMFYPLLTLIGFIPFFIYAAWLRSALAL